MNLCLILRELAQMLNWKKYLMKTSQIVGLLERICILEPGLELLLELLEATELLAHTLTAQNI